MEATMTDLALPSLFAVVLLAGPAACGRETMSPAPPDASVDGSACIGEVTSTLPGVSLAFTNVKCAYSLAEVAAGIHIAYEVRVAQPQLGLHPVSSDYTGCQGPDDTTGLIVNYDIAGASQHYCLCDQGFCTRRDYSTGVAPGTYPFDFAWSGRNWLGRSDTNAPMGSAFPAGTYDILLTSEGTWAGGSGGDASVGYLVWAKRTITLRP
jgi:hypothetical protein